MQYRLKHLFLIPMAGLGNKMLAIASAKRLCSMTGAACTVAWDWGQYDRIFCDPTVNAVAPEALRVPEGAQFIRHLLRAEGGHMRNRRVPMTAHEYVCVMSWFAFNAVEEPRLDDEEDLDLRPWLPNPVPLVHERAAAFRERHFRQNMVGVHVRRTDHKRAIVTSPDAAYFHQLDPLVEQGVTVFLATDSRKTEVTFATRYPGRVLIYPKNPALQERMPREFQLEDTWEDLIDLSLLASCAFVIGSAESSFSRIARFLNGSPRCRLLGLPGSLQSP